MQQIALQHSKLRRGALLILSLSLLLLLSIGTLACIAPQKVEKVTASLAKTVGIDWTWSNDRLSRPARQQASDIAVASTLAQPTPSVVMATVIVPVQGKPPDPGSTDTTTSPATQPPPFRPLPSYAYPPIPDGRGGERAPNRAEDSRQPSAGSLVVIPIGSTGSTAAADRGVVPVTAEQSTKTLHKPSPAPSIFIAEPNNASADIHVFTISLNNTGTNAVRIETVEVDHSFETCSAEYNGPEMMSLAEVAMTKSETETQLDAIAVTVDMTLPQSVVRRTIDNLSIPPGTATVAGELSLELQVRRRGTPRTDGCSRGRSVITVRVITDAGSVVSEPRSWPYDAF